jgi:osmotically-inducible protein OsmY
MKKSDSQLQRDIVEELRWNPQTSTCEIGVVVKDGVATLSGTVKSYAQKLAAERAAERVGGVRAIAEDLSIKFDGSLSRTDTEIAHAVVNALRWDTQVPDDTVTARVENGWITLEGDAIWKFQSDAAERAVRYLTGVRGVTNLIRVRPRASAPVVKSKIEGALKRSAEVDSGRISVEASDGQVTLKGTVRSWAERRDAESAAWSAPGVTLVNDLLTVTG